MSPNFSRYKCIVEYLGSSYKGWAKIIEKTNFQTIAGELESAANQLSSIDKEIEIYGAGRTDAGVHATINQVFHMDLPSNHMSVSQVKKAMNFYLRRNGNGNNIYIKHVNHVSNNFHARHFAKERSYIYRIYEGDDISTFDKQRLYHIKPPNKGQLLDINAMQKAANIFINNKLDLSSFRSPKCSKKSAMCTINNIKIDEQTILPFLL